MHRGAGGSAILLVLAFLVLVAGIVVIFLSRSLTALQVSDSSMNQTRAAILAQSALDVVVGDLKQEIAATSTPTVVGNVTIYEPKYNPASPVATQMTPIRTTTQVSNPNLVRISSATSDPSALTALGLGTRASLVNSVSAPSANGRAVSLTRWNSHYLSPRQNVGSTQLDSTPNAKAFPAPDWVMVTRAGPQALTWSAALKDASVGNSRYVVGRYAFAIYDEGGLIDANVAGYPAAVTAAQAGEKGSAAMADLTQVVAGPTPQSRVDQLVGWRNYATVQPTGSLVGGYTFDTSAASRYINYLFPTNAAAPAFLGANPAAAGGRTDQVFTSRQALLRYQRATSQSGSLGLGQDDLQYLGTFTRDLNQPCFTPRATPDPSVSAPTVTYPSATNPMVQEVAATAGTQKGQLLVQQRFALSHLLLFSHATPPSTQDQADMMTYFGLTYVNRHTWTYNHGTANQVLTLAQVAAKGRAPDFFELLQAAVLNGSLAYINVNNLWVTSQLPILVVRLGADIIDQYKADNFPILIRMGTAAGVVVAGADDLPYFSEMVLWPYRPVVATDPYRSELDGYLLFELWNPHQQSLVTVPGPTRLRLTLLPRVGSFLESMTVMANGTKIVLNPLNSTQAPLPVTFKNSADFREPTLLAPAYHDPDTTDSPQWTEVSGTTPRLGLLMGQDTLPDKDYAASQGLPTSIGTVSLKSYSEYGYYGSNDVVRLEYQDPADNQWYLYQGEGNAGANTSDLTCLRPCTNDEELIDFSDNSAVYYSPWWPTKESTYYTDPNFLAFRSLQMVDPRAAILPGPISGAITPALSMRPDATAGMQESLYAPGGPTTYVVPKSKSHPAMYSENSLSKPFNGLTTSNSYLYDADGVLRPGDGALGASPYAAGAAAARPLVLHRPFRSVAEMGYAYRGLGAWKTVNFFSPESADAGLLDYFSLEDAPIVAGKINLNTRQPAVLQAALSGAYRDEATGDYLTPSDAFKLAAAIVTHTSTVAPLMSRADLVRGLLSDPAVTAAIDGIQGTVGGTALANVKTRREAMIRALADTGTTRTWNLMIDLIAQSGRYAPAAAALDQFTVEGEKRYWLHIAIDRYTGKVVDRQLEEVTE